MNDSRPTFDALIHRSALPRLEARMLIEHAASVPRTWLAAHGEEIVPAPLAARIEALLARRRAGEPMAYLCGVRAFHGLTLHVNPSVLIPRPETELLVDWVITHLDPGASVVDLGTGSGAIAIALAQIRSDLSVHATDVSPAALAVARANAERHGVRIVWHEGTWYDALPVARRFDALVSNPPYIAADDPHLSLGDLRHEPRAALTDEADGLTHLRALINGARARLEPAGLIALEHGWQQAPAVRELLLDRGYVSIESVQDLAGHERITCARAPGPLE